MTDDELRALANRILSADARTVKAEEVRTLARECNTLLYLVGELRAKDAERGEIVSACPRCTSNSAAGGVIESTDEHYLCTICGHEYVEPIYYQRVKKGPA